MSFKTFDPLGYSILENAASAELLATLRLITEHTPPSSSNRRGGIRNAFSVFPDLWSVYIKTNAHHLLVHKLGAISNPTRAILFDKTPESNWSVEWHQDTSVAVANRIDTPGFGPWSVKTGVHHVRPPVDVLRSMITVRLHLDDCPESNGPIAVIPESHILTFDESADTTSSTLIPVNAGDAVLMRPMIHHASSKATKPNRRRVLHVEYATESLPGDLEWNGTAPATTPST